MAEADSRDAPERSSGEHTGHTPRRQSAPGSPQVVVYLPPLWDCLRLDLQQALRALAPGRVAAALPEEVHPRLAAAARLTYMLRERPAPELRVALLRALATYAFEMAWALQQEGARERATEYYLAYFHLLHEAPTLDPEAAPQQRVALGRYQMLVAKPREQRALGETPPEQIAVALASSSTADVQAAWLKLMERLATASPSAAATLAARLWALSTTDPRAEVAANILSSLVPALSERSGTVPERDHVDRRSILEAAYAELVAALQELEARVAAGKPAAWSHAEWMRLEEAQRALAEQLSSKLAQS
jgi:hypothetical protein